MAWDRTDYSFQVRDVGQVSIHDIVSQMTDSACKPITSTWVLYGRYWWSPAASGALSDVQRKIVEMHCSVKI